MPSVKAANRPKTSLPMEAADFKRLFMPCQKRLFEVAWRLTGAADRAADLVQDTYLRLWLRRGEFPLPASAEAYSIKTLRRVWLDSCHKRQPEPMAKLPETPGCAEAEGHCSRDDARLVKQLVARLPADQRRVVAMRDLEGLSYAEIAQQTGLTQTNIRSLVSRGRKTVREQFKHIEDHGR